MLTLLPTVLLVFTALAVLLWRRFRPGFGVPWLLASSASLLVWGALIWLRFRLPVQAALSSWKALGEASDFPFFQLDPVSWTYAIALAGLLLGVMLTVSARLAYQTSPYAWAANLFISGAGFLAVLSANPLTLAGSWMLIDLIELVILLGAVQQTELGRQVTVAFATRVTGTFLLIWSILRARSLGVTLTFTQVPPEVAVFLLAAAGLRLGVLPLHLPYASEVYLRRGVSTVLRMVVSLSSLILLARLPAAALAPDWSPWLLTLTAISAVYGGFMWLFSKDELNGRPYWLITTAAFAVTCTIHGQPNASLAWGLGLVLSGGLLFLYSARQRQVYFLPLLGLLGLIGLPFTPAAAGWAGLWAVPFSLVNILYLLAHILLVAGYLRHAFEPGDLLTSMDNWVQGMYPFGLILLVATQWLAAYFALPASFTPALVWQGLVSILVALAGLALYARRPSLASPGWLAVLAQRVGAGLEGFFSFRWLYSLFSWAYGAGRRLVRLATTILEGDGGVLWAILLLMLLISLLRGGGSR